MQRQPESMPGKRKLGRIGVKQMGYEPNFVGGHDDDILSEKNLSVALSPSKRSKPRRYHHRGIPPLLEDERDKCHHSTPPPQHRDLDHVQFSINANASHGLESICADAHPVRAPTLLSSTHDVKTNSSHTRQDSILATTPLAAISPPRVTQRHCLGSENVSPNIQRASNNQGPFQIGKNAKQYCPHDVSNLSTILEPSLLHWLEHGQNDVYPSDDCGFSNSPMEWPDDWDDVSTTLGDESREDYIERVSRTNPLGKPFFRFFDSEKNAKQQAAFEVSIERLKQDFLEMKADDSSNVHLPGNDYPNPYDMPNLAHQEKRGGHVYFALQELQHRIVTPKVGRTMVDAVAKQGFYDQKKGAGTTVLKRIFSIEGQEYEAQRKAVHRFEALNQKLSCKIESLPEVRRRPLGAPSIKNEMEIHFVLRHFVTFSAMTVDLHGPLLIQHF